MEFMVVGIAVIGIFVVIAVLATTIGIYNALMAIKENVNKAWANIDVILKQRYDEIPQLIKICEQYVQFEQGMIDRMMDAREKMVQGRSVEAKAEASSDLTAGIKGLLAVGEAYPDLKSNANFMQIQTRLSRLEETLADRREFYNDSVNVLNTRIQQIPDVFFARMMGVERRQMFEVHESEKKLPDLNINFKK